MADDLARLGLFVDSTGVVRATDHLGKFGKEGQRAEGIAGKFGKTGKAAFGAVAVAAAGAVSAIASIGAAVSVIRQFETSMSQVAAITGATATELEALRDVAKDLGSTTEFSAAQAADGLRFLGMAGFNAAESMKAIPAVLDLATASAMGLAEAADISSNVLSGFGLAAGDAAQVADVLAAASSRSNTSVSQLGGAMSTVAPIAAALDISLQDTAAAIGVMSDAGIQGERAGTALRGVLASLAGPTDAAADALSRYGLSVADVDPATRSLTEIFGQLQDRGLSTADAMTIFGREAASGALVLTEASDRVGEFGEELGNVEGAAADMAGIMRDNLGGAANTLMSTVQGLAIALGEAGLTAVLIGALNAATEFARRLTDVAVAVGDFFAKFQGKDQIQAAFETATDNVTIALGDQIRQLGQLQQAMQNSGAISLVVAESRLMEAEAIRDVIAAEKEQLVQKTLLEAGYGELLGRLESTRAAMRGVNAALSEGDGAAAMQVESYRQLEQTMIALLDEQQQMLASARETVTLSEEQEQAFADAESAAATLREQIANMKDGLVLVNGQWVDIVDLSARGAANANAGAGAARGLAVQLSSAAAQARVLVANLGFVPTALGSLAETVASQVESMTIANASLRDQIDNGTNASIAAIKAERAALLNRMELEGADMVAQSEAIKRFDDKIATLETLTETNEGLTDALAETTSATTASGGAASAAAKDFDKLNSEIQSLEFEADPLKKYNAELANLDMLLENGLSDGAYAAAVEDLNAQFLETSPILSEVNDAFGQMVDYMFDGFKDGMKGILNIFVNSLKSMAAAALKNRITIGIGAAATGAGGAAMAGQGGGILSQAGSLMGGSGFLGLGGGTGSLFGGAGLLGMGGGTGFLGLGAGSGLAGALGGGAFGAAASVALPVIGIGLALVGLFKKTEVLVAEGVRARIEGASLELDSYEKTKQDNAFGMSSGFSRDFTRLDDSVQSAVQTRLDATIDALDAFGLGTDLTGFSYRHRTEVKDGETFEGESEEVIRAALSEAIKFATEGALEAFQRSGEEMSDTLDRLTLSIGTVNQAMELLNMGMVNQTLENADMASTLIEMSGGMEAFSNSLGSYYQAFYSEGEQMRNLLAGVQKEFAALGLKVPETRDGFRAMVESLDVTTASGAQTFAMMMQVAVAMDTVYSAASNAASGMASLSATLSSGISYLTAQVGGFADATFAAESAVDASQVALQQAKARLANAVSTAMREADQRLASAERQMQTAHRNLNQAIQRQASSITDQISDLSDRLAEAESELSDALGLVFGAIDREIEGLSEGIDAAAEAADSARGIFEKLRDALDARRLGTIEEERMLRERALAELRTGTRDEDRLSKILATLNAPSKNLFGSATDYALDYARTTAAIREQKEVAESQLSAADTGLAAAEMQVTLLQDQKKAIQQQYDALLGIDSSTISVAQAVTQFETASASYSDFAAFHATEVARLEEIRDGLNVAGEEVMSVEQAVAALAEASATYEDERAWHAERMTYLKALVDKYDLQMDPVDQLEEALKDVIDASQDADDAQSEVVDAIDRLATAMVGALMKVEGTALLQGMGADAFSVFSDDRTNAILSDAAADLLTGSAKAINQAFDAALGRNVGAAGLAYYSAQMDAGRTIPQILKELFMSEEAQTGVVPGFSGTGTGFTANNIPQKDSRTPLSEVEAVFMSMLGRMPSGDFWENSGLTGGALVDAIRSGAIANGEVPAYARGGMHSGGLAIVGEEGPELVNMGPSRVYTASQTRDMLSNRELVEEIKALRSEVSRLAAYNRQTTINTGDTARRIKDFDRNGLPKERTA
jgi:TP901 family phage tail tape measure protein